MKLNLMWRIYVILIVIFALFGCLPLLGVNFIRLFEGIADFIFENSGVLAYDSRTLALAAFETLVMAFVGTSLGFAAAVMFSRFQATRYLWFFTSLKSLTTISLRAIPDLVFALLLVQIFGLGPLSGALAIALGTLGTSARLLEDSRTAPAYAFERQLLQMGTNPLTSLFISWPAAARDLLPQYLFRLEANIRIATIIGVVGGGGLGELLRASFGIFNYGGGLQVVAVISLLILITEALTLATRRLLFSLQQSGSNSIILLVFWSLATWASIGIVFVWIAQGPAFRAGKFWSIFLEMIQIDFFTFGSAITLGALQSVQMGLAAGLLAFLLGTVVATLSSLQILQSIFWSSLIRGLLAVGRSLPTIVLAIVLVTQLGLGYLTGLLAMVIGLTFFSARLVGDAVEALSFRQVNAIRHLGVNRLQLASALAFSALRPQLIKIAFYCFDFGIRYSVILGLVGAGGLGTVISGAIRVQDFRTLSACLILLVGILLSMEAVRFRILNSAGAQNSYKSNIPVNAESN